MARIDPDDPRPPYHQIADDLRQAIRSGKLAPGKKVDSSRDLAAKYGVAAMTVHQAIRVLRDEGLVDSFQGRGVFIRAEGAGPQAQDLPTAVAEIRQQVADLSEKVDAAIATEVADLRRQIGALQAQLMELYARTGNAYPHHTAAADATPARRSASGA